MKMLETIDLTVGYDKKEVVSGIKIEALKGQLVCLLGPNGSGKSTILKSLSALLAPLKGAIYIQGKELSGIKRKNLSKILAVVLTERLNVGFLNAFDVAAMGRYPHTGVLGGLTELDKEKVWECLRMVNAENIALRYYNELSDGERQKVLLARALAQDPELIILDEPTTHLDVKHKLDVMSILKRLSREKGITVIFSLHEVDLALKTCDMAVLLKDGKIVDFGSPEEVGSNKAISDLYDIKCAGFSAFMGTVELYNYSVPSVFVVGGGGKATGIYRLLTRNNIGFYTGILHENDVDCHIVETMGVLAVKEKPFEIIGERALSEAKRLVEKTSLMVDAGFPVSEVNAANQKLVLGALQADIRVCSIRNEMENYRLYGEFAGRLVHCRTASEILQYCTAL